MSAHSQFIHRELTSLLMERIRSNKVLLIYGTRRVGKTELARHLASGQENPLFLNAEDERVQRLLSVQSRDRFEQLVGASTLVFLDEAQAIPEVGKRLKFLVDEFPHLTVVATGSSSLDLNASVGEPLTGRQVTHELFPFSMAELVAYEGRFTVIKVYDEVRLRSGY